MQRTRARARLPWLLVACSLRGASSARYQLCNFSCPDEQWTACRAEKCTPRLPEDMCADGQEPELAAVPDAKDGEGLGVPVPQDCAQAEGQEHYGSFAERCDLCLELTTAAVDLVRKEPHRLKADTAATFCEQAALRAEALFPTVRTCRLAPQVCSSLMERLQESTCPHAWEQLTSHTSRSSIYWQQRQQCGELLRQRNTTLADALVCPAPRDTGTRVLILSAIVAAAIFVAQLKHFS